MDAHRSREQQQQRQPQHHSNEELDQPTGPPPLIMPASRPAERGSKRQSVIRPRHHRTRGAVQPHRKERRSARTPGPTSCDLLVDFAPGDVSAEPAVIRVAIRARRNVTRVCVYIAPVVRVQKITGRLRYGAPGSLASAAAALQTHTVV